MLIGGSSLLPPKNPIPALGLEFRPFKPQSASTTPVCGYAMQTTQRTQRTQRKNRLCFYIIALLRRLRQLHSLRFLRPCLRIFSCATCVGASKKCARALRCVRYVG